MTGLLFCLSAAAMGVDYGWQPVAGGGIEYIIQVDPALLDSLKAGHDLFSDLPSSVSNVRRYRITVGNERLPHHGEPPPAVVPASGQAPSKNAASQSAAPAEIDTSQLPGPVLGPALVLEAPTNQDRPEDDEPGRLADSEGAEPLGSRVTGFRQPRNQARTEAPAERQDEPTEERQQPSSASKEQKTTTQKEEVASQDPESPSDRPSAKPDESLTTKTALTRVGLFTSLCLNVFLLWVTTGQRSRYRALVRRMFEGSGAALTNRDAELPRWERLPAPAGDDVPDASEHDSRQA
ncbi:MAG TPA: hypothetical protein VG826_08525 [Pirellulales bacterium]|nr:hypothetical protein [Pirellulales bacterium]